MATVGYATMPVIPSLQGVSSKIASQIGAPLKQAGRKAGTDLGNAIASGVEASKARVEKATAVVAAARNKEADAAGRVRVAEAQLQALRDKGITDAGRLAQAEERVNTARRNAEVSTARSKTAVDSLAQAQSAAASSADRTASSVSTLGQRAITASNGLDSAASKVRNFSIAAGAGLALLGKQSFDAASRSEQSAGAIAAVFGDATTKMNQLASQSAQSVGLATSEYSQLGAVLGAQMKNLGVSQNDLTGTTDGLIKTGADLAAQFGGTTKDAVQALSALFRGERDPIERYGVSIKDAQIQALLASRGMDKLSGAAKVNAERMATMELLTKQTSSATGAFGRESNTAAGQQQRMNAELENAKSSLGTSLLPIVSKAAQQFAGLARYFRENQTAAKILVGAIGIVAVAYGTLRAAAAASAISAGIHAAATGAGTAALSGNTLALGAHTVATNVSTIATKASAAAMRLFGVALRFAMGPIGLIVIAIAALVAGVILAYKHSETFRNIVQGAWNGIKVAVSAVWGWLSTTVFPFFKAALSAIGTAAMWLWNNAIKPAWAGIQIAIGIAWNIIKGYFAVWSAVFRAAGEVVMWLWNNVISPAFNGISAVIGFVWNSIIKPAFDGFKLALNVVGDAVMWLWNTVMVPAWDGIKKAISTVWDFIKPILDNIGKGIQAVGDIASKVGDAMRNAFNGVVDVLKAPIHAVGSLLASVPEKVLGISIPGASSIRSWGQTLQGLRAGGQVRGAGGPTDDKVLMWGSNGEFMMRNKAVKQYGLPFMNAVNSGTLPGYATGGLIEPYGLPNGTNTGGYGSGGAIFPKWVHELGAKFNVKPSTYPGHQESDRNEAGYAPNPNHLNRGIDWSGSTADMQKFAEYLLSIAPTNTGLEQIIWQNPGTGQKIGWHGRQPDDGSYFASDYPGHQDHVHLRAATAIGEAAKPVTPDTNTKTPEYQSPNLNQQQQNNNDDGGANNGNGGSSTTTKKMKSLKELGSDVGGLLGEGVSEFFGDYLPTFITDPQSYIDSADTGENVRTSGNNQSTNNQNQNQNNNQDSQNQNNQAPAAPAQPQVAPPTLTGSDKYAYEIAKAAKDMGLTKAAAKIGEATSLVESGDPLKMWANNAVPESLKFPHDAVGSDHDSVGLYQQRDNGAWGTLAQRMSPYESAKLFFGALVKVNGWESMDPGAAAQAVQRSAFPDRYSAKMSRATQLVDKTKLFDTGGRWAPGTFGFNGLDEPEFVLRQSHWDSVDSQTDAVRQLVRTGGGGGNTNITVYGNTVGDIVTGIRREQWKGSGGYGSRGR